MKEKHVSIVTKNVFIKGKKDNERLLQHSNCPSFDVVTPDTCFYLLVTFYET